MIGFDTNVLVRYLTQDDPEQAALPDAVIAATATAFGAGCDRILSFDRGAVAADMTLPD